MKKMMGGAEKPKVFEYQPNEEKEKEGQPDEPEIELPQEEDDEIKCEFGEDALEYSAEHLEDFMCEL